jgi:long-chain acyl-CoA synthetase
VGEGRVNFATLLDAALRRDPDTVALVWEGGALTRGALWERAAAVARELDAAGVGPGDRVAIPIGNRWEFVAAALGAWVRGATVAPVDVLLKSEERAALLADLAPRAILREVRPADGPRPGLARPTGPGLILYTSGSTGRPKGAVLSHAALAFAIDSWRGPVMDLSPEDVVLGVLPFAHSFGLCGALLAPLLSGSRIALVERFAADGVLEAIERHRVTVFPGVATMFRRVLDSPRLAATDLGSLRIGVSGAAPCPWELASEWRERTGVRIVRGYGMTELFRPISYLAGDPRDLADAIGLPVPGVEVVIVDDDGRPAPGDAVGELWIKTPAAMDTYLNAPEETREVLEDGWFKTGDLASLTGEGFVRIVGRKRERILRGGYSIFPQEVEAVLVGHPAVAEAAVVGLPHPELGEEVAAFVALRGGAACRAEELVAYCRERLAAFKYPRTVTVMDALPRGATGKILKSRLRATRAPGSRP